MLFQVIVFVILLMVITYAWPPGSRGISGSETGGGRVFGAGGDPFRGRHKAAPQKPANHIINKGGMTRCHNCSSFFPMGQVVHDIVEGHLLEFCSTTCRENFLHPRGK